MVKITCRGSALDVAGVSGAVLWGVSGASLGRLCGVSAASLGRCFGCCFMFCFVFLWGLGSFGVGGSDGKSLQWRVIKGSGVVKSCDWAGKQHAWQGPRARLRVFDRRIMLHAPVPCRHANAQCAT